MTQNRELKLNRFRIVMPAIIVAVFLLIPYLAFSDVLPGDGILTGPIWIRNAWQPSEYLCEDNGRLVYGFPSLEDQGFQWMIEDTDGSYRIINRATGHFININGHRGPGDGDYWNDPVWCNYWQESDSSYLWMLQPLGDACNITSVLYGSFNLHVQDQNGTAQCSDVSANWGSTQWVIEEVGSVSLPTPSPTPVPIPTSVPTSGDNIVRIKNRWQEMYLYQNGKKAEYGNVSVSDSRSQWIVEDSNGCKRIKNKATGDYLTIEKNLGYLECLPVDSSTVSDQWLIDNAVDEGYKLIRNVQDTDKYAHIEELFGYAQYGVIPPNWWSPQWSFITVSDKYTTTGFVRLRNQWQGTYLYEENGMVKYGSPDVLDGSSHWAIDIFEGYCRLRNRATGHFVNIEGNGSYLNPLKSTDVYDIWASAKWIIEETATEGYWVVRNLWQSDSYIHVEDQTGFAQCSSIPPNWGSVQWDFEEAPVGIPPLIPTGYVLIVSKSQGVYLYENSRGIVLYGSLDNRDPRAHWLIDNDDGVRKIRNRFTGNFIVFDEKTAFLECLPGTEVENSAQWSVETAPATAFTLIRNLNQASHYIQIQNLPGFAQCGFVSVEKGTTQWALVQAPSVIIAPPSEEDPGPTSTRIIPNNIWVRIRNGKTGFCLSEGDGGLLCVTPVCEKVNIIHRKSKKRSNRNTEWQIEDFNGHKRIRNRATGHYIAAMGLDSDELISIPTSSVAPNAQWFLESSLGYTRIRTADQTDRYITLESRKGGVHLSFNPPDASGAQWLFENVLDESTYQAEDAFLTGGVTLSTAYDGYTGKGYINNFFDQDSNAVFTVNSKEKRNYKIRIRYSNGSEKTGFLSVYVNGLEAGIKKRRHCKTTGIQFKSTGDWNNWNEVLINLPLRKELNTISLKNDSDEPVNVAIDSIIIEDSINIDYRGATLPYVTYEVEDGKTNGTIIGPDRVYRHIASEASGRKAVKLDVAGQYVDMKIVKPANSMVIRYCIPDAPEGGGINTSISMYINGRHRKNITLSSRYSWVYGKFPWSNDPEQKYPHRFFDETRIMLGHISANSTIRLQKEIDDNADWCILDLVEVENVAPAYRKPANFISITDFGALANVEVDNNEAITNCINAAVAQGKGVWIPEGQFKIMTGPIDVSGVMIRGAGMWYSVLSGLGASFKLEGDNCKFYDFAIDGGTVVRVDSALETGFDGNAGKCSVIQNIWMEHLKCGIWVNAPTEDLLVTGCRIRNTFADGINFSSGTKDSVVEQCNLRNTGDDAIAVWSATYATNKPSSNNVIRYNTVQLPWLANNIAVYGGRSNKIRDNICLDTIAFGAGINISSNFNPVPFSGITLVERNTLIRCGGHEYNVDIDYGGIWINCANQNIYADIIIRDNQIFDSTYQGISIQGPARLEGMVFDGNIIDHTGTWGISIANNAFGSAMFDNIIVRYPRIEGLYNGAGSNFIIERGQDNSGW